MRAWSDKMKEEGGESDEEEVKVDEVEQDEEAE